MSNLILKIPLRVYRKGLKELDYESCSMSEALNKRLTNKYDKDDEIQKEITNIENRYREKQLKEYKRCYNCNIHIYNEFNEYDNKFYCRICYYNLRNQIIKQDYINRHKKN